MGLGDLLNLDYGYGWDFNGGYDPSLMNLPALDTFGTEVPLTLGALDMQGVNDPAFIGSLGGGVPSQQQLDVLQSAGSQNNADTIARMQADVAAGRAPNPQDLRVLYSNFGIPFSSADVGGLPGTKGGLLDGIRNLLGGGGSGDGSGGGNAAFSLPRFETPQAPTVPKLGYEAPSPPQPLPFTPTNVDVMPKENLAGLARLLGRR